MTRILLVAGKSSFRLSEKVVLEQEGFRVAEAGTGEEALYRILTAQRSGEPFDLLVAELRMQGISGLDLLDEVRAMGIPVPPCVLIRDESAETPSGQNPGEILEWLERPFRPRDLIGKAKAVLARRKDQAA